MMYSYLGEVHFTKETILIKEKAKEMYEEKLTGVIEIRAGVVGKEIL